MAITKGQHRLELESYLNGAHEDQILLAGQDWKTKAEALQTLATALESAAKDAELKIGNQTLTGPAMRASMSDSASSMAVKAGQLKAAGVALVQVANKLTNARSELDAMEDLKAQPEPYTPPAGTPGVELTDAEITAQGDARTTRNTERTTWQGAFDDQEAKAAQKVTMLDTKFLDAIPPMQAIHGQPDPTEPPPPPPGQPSGPGFPAPAVPGGTPGGGGNNNGNGNTGGFLEPVPQGPTIKCPPVPPVPVDPIDIDCGPGPGTPTPTPPGNPVVNTPVHPTPGTPTGPTGPVTTVTGESQSGISYSSGASGASSPGSGGAGSGAAASGGLGGAGLTAGGGMSSGSPTRAGGVRAGAAKAIGSTGRTGSPGALSRGSAGSPTARPTASAGGRAAGGRAGAATGGATGAAGRSAGSAGSAGGRGAGGTGAARGAGGRSTGGRGTGVAASGRGGGKGDRKAANERDALVYDQDWLGDEDVAPSVLD